MIFFAKNLNQKIENLTYKEKHWRFSGVFQRVWNYTNTPHFEITPVYCTRVER